jgi:hypothetical protein
MRSFSPFHSLIWLGQAVQPARPVSKLDGYAYLLAQIVEDTAYMEDIVWFNKGDGQSTLDFLPDWRAKLIGKIEEKARDREAAEIDGWKMMAASTLGEKKLSGQQQNRPPRDFQAAGQWPPSCMAPTSLWDHCRAA